MADKEKVVVCGHDRCTCAVVENDEYCSPQCSTFANDGITEGVCECGHPDCDNSID